MTQFTYKKAQVKGMDMKTGSNILLFIRDTLQSQRQTLPQSKGLRKDFPSKRTKKQAGVAILTSSKIDFKLKSIRKDGEGHFIYTNNRNNSSG